MPNLLDIIGMFGGQQPQEEKNLSLGANLNPMPAPQAAPQPQKAESGFLGGLAGGHTGLLGILATLGNLEKLGNGDLSPIEAMQKQSEAKKKAAAQKREGELTAGAFAAKPNELASPDKIYQAFLDQGLTPDDAASALSRIQSQQEKMQNQQGDQAFIPLVESLLPQVQNPAFREAISGSLKTSPKNADRYAQLTQTELSRQTAAGERDLRKQERALTTRTEAAKQTVRDLGTLSKDDQALTNLTTKLQGKGAKVLTIGDIFGVDLEDPQSIQEFATKYMISKEDAKLAIANLQKSYQAQAPGTFEFFSDKNKLQLGPTDVQKSIQSAGSPEQIQALQQAKATISQGAEQRAEIRAYEPKSKKEKEIFNKTKAKAKLMSPEIIAAKLKELDAIGAPKR